MTSPVDPNLNIQCGLLAAVRFYHFCHLSSNFQSITMAKGLAPMEVDNAASQRKLKKGLSSGKAAKKEMKQSLKREKKKLAKVVRNKKTAAEFSNHKPKASKNTMDHLAKNCY